MNGLDNIQTRSQRFRLTEAIWDKLEETDNPTWGATPNKDNQYELVLFGRVILYEIRLFHKIKYPLERGVSNLYCGSYTGNPALENA
ncbi:MAG: hypothetical protein AAF639_28815 [Chloroflexota bacterium]